MSSLDQYIPSNASDWYLFATGLIAGLVFEAWSEVANLSAIIYDQGKYRRSNV